MKRFIFVKMADTRDLNVYVDDTKDNTSEPNDEEREGLALRALLSLQRHYQSIYTFFYIP